MGTYQHHKTTVDMPDGEGGSTEVNLIIEIYARRNGEWDVESINIAGSNLYWKWTDLTKSDRDRIAGEIDDEPMYFTGEDYRNDYDDCDLS